MASTIRDYSATAASNTAVDGADISEGCSPAGINDAIRGVMADLKDVSTGAVSLESTAADSLSLTGALTTTSTIDGRDVAADGTKLDGIAAGATAGTDVVQDTTPQLGGNLDVNGQDIVSTSNGDIDLDPNGSGKVVFKGNATKGSGQFVLNCEQNSHGIVIKGPPHSAAASYTLTLPNNDGSASEFLQTDGSGNLSWGAGATAYTDSNVDTHLNTGTAATGEILSWTGSDYDWVASGGGGADLYTANESSPAAQPSATGTNAIAIGDSSVSSGEKSISLGKANASGNNSFAVQINNNTTSYGAIDNYALSIGYMSKSSGSNYATALGGFAIASGAYSSALTYGSQALADYSVALGMCLVQVKGKVGFGAGYYTTFTCSGLYTLNINTTNASQTTLTTNNSSASSDNQVIANNNTLVSFHGTINGRQKASEGTACAAWKVEGLLRREASAGTTVLVNSAITVLDNTPNWGMALSADTSNGALKIAVTGASSTNIRWQATIHTSENGYA